MRPRLLCSDIDGTLLNADRQLSPRTLAAYGAIRATTPLVLASSRMPKAMRHLQVDLGIGGAPLICYNGGLVLGDEQEGTPVLNSLPVPLAVVRDALDWAQGTEVHVGLYQYDQWLVPRHDFWTAREINNTKVDPDFVGNLHSATAQWVEGAHKVMCMGPAEQIQVMYDRLQARHGDAVHTYRSKDTYIEISHKAISKASALALVLARYHAFGMEAVAAFGDNYNDIDLLQAVGVGVAVENARLEVKAVADMQTSHHKADGVAKAIERLLELGDFHQ